jgi:N-acetylmuramic acid 6-phosphate etherase
MPRRRSGCQIFRRHSLEHTLRCEHKTADRAVSPDPAPVPAPTPDSRVTEHRNPRTVDIDLASPIAIVDLINAEDQGVADAVATQREPIAAAIALIEAAFRSGHRLLYVGAGTSGRLGVLDASECPPTFQSDPSQVVGLIAGGDGALRRSSERRRSVGQ